MPNNVNERVFGSSSENGKETLSNSINLTESESIGSNLEQMSIHDDEKPSGKPSLDDFVLPSKRGSLVAHKAEEKRKKSKKEPPREVPSLADIKLLHARRKEILSKVTSNQTQPNQTQLGPSTNMMPNDHKGNASSSNPGLRKPAPKQGEIGSLGDDMHGRLADVRSQIGDIGSLGASTVRDEPSKKEEAAWKRKLEDLGSLSEQPKNPETPSSSDIGELATFKKEMSAAIKGLGPEATFMMKKSRVPKPSKLYWGINAIDSQESDGSPTQRRYWGINALNKGKDSIPGKVFMYCCESYLL